MVSFISSPHWSSVVIAVQAGHVLVASKPHLASFLDTWWLDTLAVNAQCLPLSNCLLWHNSAIPELVSFHFILLWSPPLLPALAYTSLAWVSLICSVMYLILSGAPQGLLRLLSLVWNLNPNSHDPSLGNRPLASTTSQFSVSWSFLSVSCRWATLLLIPSLSSRGVRFPGVTKESLHSPHKNHPYSFHCRGFNSTLFSYAA